MKIENAETFGWEGAIRGMRNPMDSWARSDSQYVNGEFIIGEKDLDLASRLIKAGNEHRKYLRMIHVQVDITAPLYLWKEFDKYQIAVVTNSCSTMHKITSYPITIDCFEIDDYDKGAANHCAGVNTENDGVIEKDIIPYLEGLRQRYLDTKDMRYWKELIRWLPESWLQKRTVDLNYEVLRNIYHQRKTHKLTEWHTICDWIKTLPYAQQLITDGE